MYVKQASSQRDEAETSSRQDSPVVMAKYNTASPTERPNHKFHACALRARLRSGRIPMPANA